MLLISVAGASAGLLLMPLASSLPLLVALSILFGAFASTATAMVFSLLALETPSHTRSATLNLVYLPIYIAGIVGPLVAAPVARIWGLPAVFVLAAACYLLALIPLWARLETPEAGVGEGAQVQPRPGRFR